MEVKDFDPSLLAAEKALPGKRQRTDAPSRDGRNRVARSARAREDHRFPQLVRFTGTHVKEERQLGLPANAILPSRICDAGNNPFTIRTNKIEQVRPAVVHLAIHQKLERSPHHRQIVIDPH